MDPELERQIRAVMAAERFGVLATISRGRLHTATIHFAETPRFELVHAIRPATLKAQLAEFNPHVAFQVDNRALLMESRDRFTRIAFEGTLEPVSPSDAAYANYHDAFAQKLPVGARLLADPSITLYVLRPFVMRVAVGAAPAEDYSLS